MWVLRAIPRVHFAWMVARCFAICDVLARGNRALTTTRNLACVNKINLWGVEWRGDLVGLASKSHRVIRVVT